MPRRRDVIGLLGATAGAAAVGLGAAVSGTSGDDGDDHDHGGGSGGGDSAVAYVRNVEEVRGHLTSSVELLDRGREDDAALHASHGPDYFAPVLTPVRDEEPALATRLRGLLRSASERISTSDAEEYEQFVTEDVFPLLDDAVAAVVAEETRDSVAFDVRVMDALAGRIAEEYAAAVPEAGTVELAGEYWDGRGFLTRIEHRHEAVGDDLDDATAGALAALRSEMEAVEAPETVRATTLELRVAAAAAADLPSASVESRDDAVTYLRNVEEVRGHAHASLTLLEHGDADAAGFHAGHGADYVTTLLPAVQRADPDLSGRLRERILALDARAAESSASEYERFVTEELFPLLEDAVATVVPGEYRDPTSVSASVLIALLERTEEEYDAAVTDEEVIELYGEYWDARGFFVRVRRRYEGTRDGLSEETRELVEPELDILGEELRTAAPPRDVANSIAPLTDDLGRAVEAE